MDRFYNQVQVHGFASNLYTLLTNNNDDILKFNMFKNKVFKYLDRE